MDNSKIEVDKDLMVFLNRQVIILSYEFKENLKRLKSIEKILIEIGVNK